MALCRRLSPQTLIFMITKDELERLKQPSHKNAELRYTIGGAVEAEVHSSVESERIAKLQHGHRAMHKAVQDFRNEMIFKSREGQARAQFMNNNTPPPEDRAVAENTWRQNHMQAHENSFQQSSEDFKQQTASAFQNDTKAQVATDRKTQSRQHVQDFKAAMTHQQSRINER